MPCQCILVVEDDAAIREVLANVLLDQDYAVDLATDGREIWQRLAERQPDLILLDLMLPYEDGMSICRRLRAQPATRRLPVLVVSAFDQPSTVQAVLGAGADAFLAKPFELEQLIDLVAALLDPASPQAQRAAATSYAERRR